jgi:hypothetical protein
MKNSSEYLIPLALCLLLNACANIPKTVGKQLPNDKPLELITDEQGRQVSRYVDAKLLKELTGYALPDAKLILPNGTEDISQTQLDLISNALNRSMCNRLGQYLTPKTSPVELDLRIDFALTGITATSRAASGLSSAAGFFVPGPFRIPIGMGAIALDAKATSNQQTAAFIRWAKGANPVFNSGKVSTIADAYELVETFSREFSELLLSGANKVTFREKLSATDIELNEALCLANYGAVDTINKGASFLLPLSPEFIDKGKPSNLLPLAEEK